MKRELTNAHSTDEFVERSLARIEHINQVARGLTEALGLPPESFYSVLSSLSPFLLEELYERTSSESAPVDEQSLAQDLPEQTMGDNE